MWKGFLHKQVVEGLGYVDPGSGWNFLRAMEKMFDQDYHGKGFFVAPIWTRSVHKKDSQTLIYGYFQKWWYPQIIPF